MAKYLNDTGLSAYDAKIKEYISGLMGGSQKLEYRNANAAALMAGGTTHINILNVQTPMLDFDDIPASYKKFDLVAELTVVRHGDPYGVATTSAKYSIQMQGCNYSSELTTVTCISKIYDRIGLIFGNPYDIGSDTSTLIRVVAPAYSSQYIDSPDCAFDCYINRVYERTADFVPSAYFADSPYRENGAFGQMQSKPSPIEFVLPGSAAINAQPEWTYQTSGDEA